MAGSISDQTTALSNLSLTGNMLVGGFTASTSTLSAPALQVAGATAFTKLAPFTVSIVTITALVNRSTTTTVAVSGASTVDGAFITALSGLSNGLTLDAWVSDADTVTVAFSNVSAAQAVQAGPANYKVVLVR